MYDKDLDYKLAFIMLKLIIFANNANILSGIKKIPPVLNYSLWVGLTGMNYF